ncbi:glycosyltransferase [Fluviicola sp.]|jgi:glycosyltransferase involved in cell wall biosynthesis|uniref:glycosyltransferase n=1 Tax=Fluviicola sp. TaxID=1917219 RepID=UPI002822F0AE|nr:glycosyltransferase [Fluviicola sp.]MDR0801732.1 glycosyltransferase [Fluviicola sp.]
MNKILIFSNKKVSSAPRILRETDGLKDHFEIHLTGDESSFDTEHIYSCIYSFRSFSDKIKSRISRILGRRTLPVYSKIEAYIQQWKIDVLIIHEPHFLPLAAQLKEKYGIRIVFNAHEYYPLEFENSPEWMKNEGRLFYSLYQQYLSQLDLFINVCDSIREKCLSEFHTDSLVIPNAAFYSNLAPNYHTNEPIRLIHHGALLPNRKLEKMISIVDSLGPRFQLDIIGVPHPAVMDYYGKIKEACSATSNVRLITPVAFSEIIPFINQYDIGIHLLEPSSFNNFHALPNKIFEFLQAKLAVFVSPSPEMSKLVEKYRIGEVSEDFSESAMIERLQQTDLQQINTYKQNTVQAAQLETAEKYQQLYLDRLLSLLTVQ